MEQEREVDKLLDGRGWNCAWCILKILSLLRQMAPGQVLEVLCTDRQILQDLPRVLKPRGDELIWAQERPDCLSLHLRRGNSAGQSCSTTAGCQCDHLK